MTIPPIQPFIDFLSDYTTVTKEELNAMVDRTHSSSYKRNELLQRQGEIPTRVAFITKGAVRMYYVDEKGVEHTTAFALENQPLVALDAFTQQIPAAINTVALEPTELIWTSYSEFFGFLKSFPKYKAVLLGFLTEFMAEGAEQTKLLRINSSRERYEALCKMRPEVIKRVPLKYIASYLCMAEETLSRVRSKKL